MRAAAVDDDKSWLKFGRLKSGPAGVAKSPKPMGGIFSGTPKG